VWLSDVVFSGPYYTTRGVSPWWSVERTQLRRCLGSSGDPRKRLQSLVKGLKKCSQSLVSSLLQCSVTFIYSMTVHLESEDEARGLQPQGHNDDQSVFPGCSLVHETLPCAEDPTLLLIAHRRDAFVASLKKKTRL